MQAPWQHNFKPSPRSIIFQPPLAGRCNDGELPAPQQGSLLEPLSTEGALRLNRHETSQERVKGSLPRGAYPETVPKASNSDFLINPYSKTTFSVDSKGTPLQAPWKHNFKPSPRSIIFQPPGRRNAREPPRPQQVSFLEALSKQGCYSIRASTSARPRVRARAACPRPGAWGGPGSSVGRGA